VIFIGQVEKEIKANSDKLEMLNLVVNRYQSEIEGLNVNIKTVTELTSRLFEVKGKYVAMERKCGELAGLRKKVSQKEEELARKMEEQEKEEQECKVISSVETLIKIFSNNPNKTFPSQPSQLYCAYHR
jgi:chromosome segregation ATPase